MKSKFNFAALAFLIACVVFVCSQIALGAEETTASAGSESKSVAADATDREKRITIHFPDTDIRVALETLSAKVGVSIIAGPEVKGRVSLKLENVPWEKGLDILLKTYGYSYVWEEGVIRVMSREALKQMEMQTKVYQVQYADPTEVEKAVGVVLSKEVAVRASADTKTLVVKETPENQKSIQSLIEGLDRMSREMSPPGVCTSTGTEIAYPLSSMRNRTGNCLVQVAPIASQNSPSLVAPSPSDVNTISSA